MAKNKKKDTKSFLVKPQGATATAKKQSAGVQRAGKVITTVAALTPVGRGAKVASSVAKAVASRVSKKEADEIGKMVAREVAERTPRGKLGSPGGKPFKKRTEPTKPVTAKDAAGKKKSSTYGASTVEGRTARRSFEQRLGSQKGQDTRRFNKIAEAYDTANKASRPVIAKAKAKAGAKGAAVGGAVLGTAGYEAGKRSERNKKNKKK